MTRPHSIDIDHRDATVCVSSQLLAPNPPLVTLVNDDQLELPVAWSDGIGAQSGRITGAILGADERVDLRALLDRRVR